MPGMPGGDFLTGLLGGFQQSMTQGLQRRQLDDQRSQELEIKVLNHLAQSSDDEEVRAIALAGLMELSQGGGKRGGLLGLGKLRTTQSFQRLMEMGKVAGLFGGAPGAKPGGAAPAAGAPPAGPPPGDSGASFEGQGGSGEFMGPLAGLVEGAVDRPVGTPSKPPSSSTSPVAGLVGAAAQPETSPTTGGPPPVPGGASAPTGAGMPGLRMPGADVFGTRGPISTAAAQADIRGQETAAQESRQQAAFERDRLKAEAKAKADATKAEETRQRDAQKATDADNRLQARLQSQAELADKRIAASMEALGKTLNQRDRESQLRDERIARGRLDDQIASINKQRAAIRLDNQALPVEKEKALNGLGASLDDAYSAYYRETGIRAEGKRAPRMSTVGQPLESETPGLPNDTSPLGPPALPSSLAPLGGAPGRANTGPPAPPADTSQIPNWSKIVSKVEELRRQHKTPQEILALAGPSLSPAQLQALKLYLRI